MPESTEDERGGSRRGSAGRATPNPAPQSNISAQLEASRKRVGSAKYYDIASALMGKGHTGDLQELFLAAARDGDYDRIEDFLLCSGKDHLVGIDVKDKRTGNTPIIWAAKRGHNKIVQLLLKHGADITLRNYEGQTAVEVASTAIRTLLLDSVDRATESSHRLLLQAAWQGNIRVLKKLLNENRVKDLNCKNAEGLTPLLLVARDIQLFERLSTQQNRAYNPAEVVTMLLAHRADIHAVDEDGKTCIHYASQSKATLAQTVVQALITGGPDIDLQDKRLFAPIHCASQIGNVECLEVLISGGSCVNSRGFAGTTPLHISAYNDHEKAACCLLKHGANVTLTDDRGLTPLDLARGRKMKSTLKEAWRDAAQVHTPTNLAPVKVPNREETRTSLEDLSKRRKGGEVIFDNMPSNPFSNMKNTPSKGRLVSRHLSIKDKARRAEETMKKDIENGTFTPGPYVKDGVRRLGLTRNQQPSPLPKGKGYQRLPAISPDRLSIDRNQESPTSFIRNSRFRRSLDETRLSYSRNSSNLATFPVPGGSTKRVSPLSNKDGHLTPLSFDYESGPGSCRLTPCSPPPNQKQTYHHRSGSDTASTNMADVAASCDPYLLQRTGRSMSVCSKPLSQSDDFGDAYLTSPRLTPLRTPLERETTSTVHFKQSEECAHNSNTLVLDLDRMGLLKCQTPVQNAPLFPTSSKVLPPTPTMIGEKAHSCLESRMTNNDGELSKDPSPRSDEEKDKNHKKVKLAFQNSSGQLRSPSIFKDEFVLEESRPKDILIHSSGSDLSSTGSKSRSSVSSDEVYAQEITRPTAAKQRKGDNKRNTCMSSSDARVTEAPPSYSVVSVNAQNRLVSNLRTVGSKNRCGPGSNVRANAAEKGVNKQCKQDQPTAKVTKDRVAVHSQRLGAGAVFPNEKTGSEHSDQVMRQNILNSKASGRSAKEEKSAKKDNGSKGQGNQGCSPQSVREDTRVYVGADTGSSSMQVVSTKLLSNVKEEVKKARLEKGENRAPSRASNTSVSKENINQNNSGASAASQLTAGNPRKASHSPSRRPVSETVPTGNANKGNNSNPVPSYLNPTQSSITRKQNPEITVTKPHVNQMRNTSATSENVRKSATSLSSNKVASGRSAVSPSRTPQRNSSQPSSSLSQGVPQISNSASKSSQLSGVRKSLSDPNVLQESQGTVPSTAAKSGKTRSSLDLSSTAKPSPLKSSSTSTIQDTKINVDANVKAQPTGKMVSQKNPTLVAKGDAESEKKPFQYKPAGAGKAPLVQIVPDGTPRVSKPKCVEMRATVPIQTPVIVNPFEDMKPYNTDLEEMKAAANGKVNSKGVSATAYGYTVGKPSYDRSKTQTSMKSRGKSAKKQPKPESKPTSAGPNRQGGGRRQGAKSKDSKNSDEGASGRPRSGKTKRTKSGRKRKRNEPDTALSEQAAQPDVALISGIGWHVATHCMDTSDVKAVRTTGSDSSDSSDDDDLDDATPREGLTYQLRISNIPADPMSNASTPRFLEVKPEVKTDKAKLPMMLQDGYRPMNLDMTQASLPSAVSLSDVLASENPQASLPLDLTSFFYKMDGSIMEPPDALPSEHDDIAAEIQRNILMGKLTPIPESPSLKSNHMLHRTLEAIEKFDHHIQADALNNLLGLVKGGSHEPSPRVDDLHGANGQKPLDTSPKPQSGGSASFSNSARSGRQSIDRSAPTSSRESRERGVVASGASVRSSRHSLDDRGSQVSSSKERQAITSGASVRSSRNNMDDRGAMLSSQERAAVTSGASVRSSRNNMDDRGAMLSSQERAAVTSGASVRSSRNNMDDRGAMLSSQERAVVTSGASVRSSRNGTLDDRSAVLSSRERPAVMSGTTVHSSIYDREDRSAPNSSRENSQVNTGNKSSRGNSSLKQNSGQRHRLSGSQPTSRKSSSKNEKVESQENSVSRTENKAEEPQMPEKVQIEVVDRVPSMPHVPRLENLGDLHNLDNDLNSTVGTAKTEGKSSRRERKFSETKSEEKNENENIEEVIEEILSNTIPSATSTLKSRRSLRSGSKSLSSTFSEADTHLLKKLSLVQKDSPFHARGSSSDHVRLSESYDDLSVQQSTNPNLLQVFHAENFQIGRKVKAMLDAGAGRSKVKAMADVDNEAKQIAKIMNSFKQMELYAGSTRSPGTCENIPKPETSSMEPMPGKKPPSGLARPNSAGASKVRSAGRFTEMKNEKNTSASRDKSVRQSTSQRISQEETLIPTSYLPGDAAEQELASIMRAPTPDNDTILSCLGGCQSRSGSACTTISTQSSVEETIQWKKGNVLGKGAFGTVWCGLTSEGQLIAVKQIELNTSNQDKAKKEYEKVQEEVELLKTLNHKNIVGYLGTSLEENIVSIFMQFVPGGSIASILARFGALDEAVFRRFTKQVLEGVEYLHDNGVIHRDIKGANVMLMPNGIIKLIDFGCAKRLCINLSMGQSQILKSMKGTPFWMAPEVVNETGHGKKSDIWSIGCTVFEMATRKPPWADMNPMAAIFAIGSDKSVPQLPVKFSQDAISFVNACLTRDQNKRLSATQLLQHVFINKKKGSKR